MRARGVGGGCDAWFVGCVAVPLQHCIVSAVLQGCVSLATLMMLFVAFVGITPHLEIVCAGNCRWHRLLTATLVDDYLNHSPDNN